MSQYRFSSHPERYDVLVGFDHALGYFITVLDPADEEEEPIEDRCSFFDGLTGVQLVEAVEKYQPPTDCYLVDRATKRVFTWEQLRAMAMINLSF